MADWPSLGRTKSSIFQLSTMELAWTPCSLQSTSRTPLRRTAWTDFWSDRNICGTCKKNNRFLSKFLTASLNHKTMQHDLGSYYKLNNMHRRTDKQTCMVVDDWDDPVNIIEMADNILLVSPRPTTRLSRQAQATLDNCDDTVSPSWPPNSSDTICDNSSYKASVNNIKGRNKIAH